MKDVYLYALLMQGGAGNACMAGFLWDALSFLTDFLLDMHLACKTLFNAQSTVLLVLLWLSLIRNFYFILWRAKSLLMAPFDDFSWLCVKSNTLGSDSLEAHVVTDPTRTPSLYFPWDTANIDLMWDISNGRTASLSMLKITALFLWWTVFMPSRFFFNNDRMLHWILSVPCVSFLIPTQTMNQPFQKRPSSFFSPTLMITLQGSLCDTVKMNSQDFTLLELIFLFQRAAKMDN